MTTVRPGFVFIVLIALSLLLGPAMAKAGADFIGGQANAEDADLQGDPEAVQGGLEERARIMQQWLQLREDERREMGFAHGDERPRAISDDFDRASGAKSFRTSFGSGKSGSTHSRKSADSAASRSGSTKLKGRRAPARSSSHGVRQPGIAKASNKHAVATSGKRANASAKHAGGSSKRHH